MIRLAVLLAALARPVGAGEVAGPARVIDGDTIEVAGRRLDLAGIDAPELGQMCDRAGRTVACGRIARTALMDLTAGTEVTCRTGRAGAGARCADAQGFDLGRNMIYTGWALAGPGAPEAYARVEAGARAAGRGLWQGRFVAPREWRAGKRLKAGPRPE